MNSPEPSDGPIESIEGQDSFSTQPRAAGDDGRIQDGLESTGDGAGERAGLETDASSVGERAPRRETSMPLGQLGQYRIVRELGRGGMGVVYEAQSVAGGATVALKTLQHHSAGALRRFKEEFRVLADLDHVNLVRLGELVTTEREPFFTMELIHGTSLDQYVRGGFTSAATFPHLPFDETRLRDAFEQLAEGLATLHAAGCIHRDLKPSNVLVTSEGRVVILDFGLAVDEEDAELRENRSGGAGTPYFMSPEQALGQRIRTASDWYSVGIMLYEALTGERAFDARSMQELVAAKQSRSKLRPCDVVGDIPADLNQLCIDLMEVVPERRPSGDEVLRRLRGRESAIVDETIWLGREAEMERLLRAWQDIREGATRVVLVGGPSGMGKTSLVDRFLKQLRASERVVLLRGRCYENESVAYQGFDSIVDSLAAHLGRLAKGEVERVLPLDIDALCQIFPVLLDVPAIASYVSMSPVRWTSGRERRNLGFAALREMLGRLARWSPLVLFIDDLQQGDDDTAAIFRELTRSGATPACLLLATFRSEGAEANRCLASIRRTQLGAEEQSQVSAQQEFIIDRLGEKDALDLAIRLLEGAGVNDGVVAHQLAKEIVHEAKGDPLFLRMLSRHLAHRGRLSNASDVGVGRDASSRRWTLGSVIWEDVRGLEPVYRVALELLAAAGRPVDESILEAALVDYPPTLGLVRALRARRLVRRLGNHGAIEMFHDKIRETIRDRLTPASLVSHCEALGQAVEKQRPDDVEFLCDLYRRGGESLKAAEYAIRAASIAETSLAFHRAVEYYRYAFSQLRLEPERELELRVRYAEALANAGRAAESAEQYQAAAALASKSDESRYRQQAALKWLSSGHVDRGVTVLQSVLESNRLPWPQSNRRAIAGIVLRTAQLKWRGLGRSIEPAPVDSMTQQQLDACWSAAAGLSIVDPIRGSFFIIENVYRSLRVADARSVARDLAMYMGHVAMGGSRSRGSTRQVLLAARRMVRDQRDPYSQAMLSLARGIAALLRGEWNEAIRCCDRASQQLLSGQYHGATWELNTARTFALWGLQYRGDLDELRNRQPLLLQTARETNDLFATLNFGTQVATHLELAADQPGVALARIDEDRERLSDRGFYVQHHNHLLARTFIHLYEGNGIRAAEEMRDSWRLYRQAFLSQVQQVTIDHHQLHARALIAAAYQRRRQDGAKDTRWLRLLDETSVLVRHLRRANVPWATGLAAGFDACIAAVRCDYETATQRLKIAIDQLERAQMGLFALAARHHLAKLTETQPDTLGEPMGFGASDLLDTFWRERGVVNPERFAAAILPGFGEK